MTKAAELGQFSIGIDSDNFITLPSGTTAERPGSPVLGMMRYNTDTGLVEQYNNSGWAGIDAPPTITGASGIINEDTNSTITVTGSNFKSGSIAYIEGDGVSGVSRGMVTTFVDSTTITFETNANGLSFIGGTSYNIRITNPSGLSALLEPAGTVDRDPIWNAPAAGSNNTIYDHNYGGQSYIDGTDRVWVFKAGSGEWRAPATTTAEILLVGGGGGGGMQVGGGGGGGAVLYTNSFSLTEGTMYRFNVGQGGSGGGSYVLPGSTGTNNPTFNIAGSDGEDTFFGIINNEIVARGGGCGANHDTSSRRGYHYPVQGGNGRVGGSGGGGAGSNGGVGSGGSGAPYTYSGWTAHGNAGGSGYTGDWAGGGGGGAGGAGANATAATGGNGGIGIEYSISGTATYYGGGGGGCFNVQTDAASKTAIVPGGGGRGCGDNSYNAFGLLHGEDATENTGGGGGGTRDVTGPNSPGGSKILERAGNGGSGIIYIRYPIADENSTIVNLDATDPDGDAVSYSSSSTLPGGLALANDVNGFPNEVGGSTTYPLTVTATANSQTENRSFNIIVNPANDGSSIARSATSAASIKSLTGTTLSGWYWVTINGTPTKVFCDMSTNGGGWMQGMNINTRDGHIVHYVNNNFWESSTSTTSFPTGERYSTPGFAADNWGHWYQDWKALGQGNLWANYSGTQLLVVVHTNGSYLGWKSFNLNTGSVTKFSQFWQGGSSAFGYTNPGGSQVTYARRITNGAIAQDNGSLSTAEPLVRNGVNLVANAKNYSEDLNRLTVTTSTSAPSSGTASFPTGDNSGGGLGTYYDISPGGRPECDGQIFFTGTWSNGRIGDDHLNDSNYSSWNGKSNGNTDTYNWNSGSGLNYDYAFFIK